MGYLPLAGRSRLRTRPTWAVWLGLVPLGLLLLWALGTAGVALAYSGRTLPGVEVMGQHLGGSQAQDVGALLQAGFDRYATVPVTIRHGELTWHATPAELGLTLDVQATARAAEAVGRDGGLPGRLFEQLAIARSGYTVQPVLSFSESDAESVLTALQPELEYDPSNARLTINSDGTVAILPSQTGLALDIGESVQRVREVLLRLSADDIVLATRDVDPLLDDMALAGAKVRATRLISRPVVLIYEGKSWTITPQQLVDMTTVVQSEHAVEVDLDREKLTDRLQQIKQTVDREPVDATLHRSGIQLEISDGAEGASVDVEASLAAILHEIEHGIEAGVVSNNSNVEPMNVRLVVDALVGLSAADLELVKERGESLVAERLVFRHQQRSWAMEPVALAELLQIEAAGPGTPPEVFLDADGVADFVESLAERVDRPPRDARFRFVGGEVQVLAEGENGLQIDVPRTTALALEALSRSPREVEIAMAVTAPEVTSAHRHLIVVRDQIEEAITWYSGIPEKIFNIELAASRLNGTVVPPGAVFSFNRALGPTTIASGYKMGYAILYADGQMQTVPSEAGGICQVATTLFHAVFWAGYPIVERNHHLYWIQSYGQPPRGMRGLDATVYDTYGVDLRFENNTSDWLIIEAAAGGGQLRFRLRGIEPPWTVSVAQPVISNIKPAQREVVHQEDPTMPEGRTLQVEAAQDGFRSDISRVVTHDDGGVEEYVASSRYLPSRNVILVGTMPPEEPEEPSEGLPEDSEAPEGQTEEPSDTETPAEGSEPTQ